jgi:transcription termination/antitermination protein NusG
MSVQEPRDQFERESVEDEIEELQDSSDESQLSDSDSFTSKDSESIGVPAEESSLSSPDDSTLVEEADQIETDVPEVESMPLSSSDELPPPGPTEGPAWYVIHCYSGYENKVRHNLEQRIETMGMKDRIFDVVIPTQEEIEVKDGKRRTVERHIFPGYVLVNMVLTEESWYVVRNTPGVTGFVGMGNNPTPLRPEEVTQIVKRMEAEAPTVKVTFKVGERVRIIDGPFNDFRGVVSEIDMERTKVRVMVSFFGRETPVELDFLQVEKA